jgi:PAS domain S-box-containing protein
MPDLCLLNVDDDEAARRLRSELLRNAGYRVVEAATGFDALRAVEQHAPALILLDVHLPGLDGFEVCGRLKAQPQTLAIPIVLISAACVTGQDWARGLSVGADNYLVAPVAAEVLLGTIRVLVHRAQVEQELRGTQDRALETLRASERRYRHLFLNAPYGIYTVTEDGRILTANRALAAMLGCDAPDDVTTLNASAFYRRREDREAVMLQWRRDSRVAAHEAVWQNRAGQDLIVRLTGRLLDEDCGGEDTFEVFVEDITEQRRLESAVRQSQKMEAIGRLAAGIAHDFNNLLTAILGYTELMLEQIDADKPIHADLRLVQQAGQSAAALTKQLLAFGRKQLLQVEVLDLNEIVRTSAQLLRRVIGEQIGVTIETAPERSLVRADRLELEQVLLNLAVNARDAMPDGGTLTIRTAHVDIVDPHPFSRPVLVPVGRYVMVTVADNGCGMPPETLDHVFEPFFTTKEIGRGTGLGLATVYGIVKQLGGYIWVASTPQQGTTFTVYFQASADEIVSAALLEPAKPTAAVGRETILVVEDDPAVRALAASVLTRHGYQVVVAGSGAEAIALNDQRTDRFLVVVTDVVMPGMSGPALVQHLRMRGPVRAIYMSGYAGASLTPAVLDDAATFLPKPFKQSDLLDRVRQSLDACARPPDSASLAQP